MEITDGRGKHKLELKRKNTESVRVFFNNNPLATITDCQRSVGLAYVTVKRAISDINSEDSRNSKENNNG